MASNLVAAHQKFMVDALIDIQTVVECSQQDNVDLVPQCSTFYQCGLTVLDAPRGNIKKVSVVDQVDPTTHLESTTAPTDFCSEVPYNQVDACHVKRYLAASQGRGCCFNAPLFFGLDGLMCPSWIWPVPTDAGLPPGLKPLPLGFHYPQTSTDRPNGRRSRMGIWAIERGKIWLAPWIQSTETVIVTWDGIKRTWGDNDGVDEDPLLSRAVEEYVRWRHADRFEYDDAATARAGAAYLDAKAALIHQCREETRTRDCEPSFARSSVPSLTTLFYNVAQTGSASCHDGSNPTSVTIPAGSVSSTISVGDANQRALDQANTQAQAQLNCTPGQQTWTNDAQSFTATCAQGEGDPIPDGNPVTITIPAGTVTSTVSKADANQQALALATSQAEAQLSCTFWNATQSFTAVCPADHTITATRTVQAHTYSATTQAQADQLALNDATNQANAALAMTCPNLFTAQNTQQRTSSVRPCGGFNKVLVNVTINVGTVSGTGPTQAAAQLAANQNAIATAQAFGDQYAAIFANRGLCGTTDTTYPVPPPPPR